MSSSLSTFVQARRCEILQEDTGDEKIIDLWMMQHPNANTQRAYRRIIDRLMPCLVNGIRGAKLEELAAFCNSFAGDKPASRYQYICALRSLFRFCFEVGYLSINLTKFIKPPKVPNELASRILPESTIRDIVDAAPPGSRDHIILCLLFSTGCRASELVDLNWNDVRVQDNGWMFLTLHGKGDKTRTVRVESVKAREGLNALRQRRSGSGNNPVFVSNRSASRLYREDIFRLVRKWAKEAGVDANVSPHWFRHAHATYALEGGAPIHEVAISLGHENISTTERYLHARPGRSSGQFIDF